MQHTRLLIAEVLGHRFGSADCVPAHGPGELANSDREGHQSANARLIAAAPELLEACQAFFTWHAENFEDFDEQTNRELLCVANQAEAAIAKATAE